MTMTRTASSAMAAATASSRAIRSSRLIAFSLAGRLRTTRTPQDAGSTSTRASGSSALLKSHALQDDERIDGDRGTDRCDDGIEVDLEDVGAIDTEPTKRHEHRHDGCTIHRGSPAHASQQLGAAQAVEHRLGRRGIDWGQPDRDVIEDLGEDAAETDEHRRTELRVAAESEDQLHAGCCHGLDEQPPDREPAVAPDLKQAQRGAVDRVITMQPECHAPNIRLVDQA